MDKIRDEAMKRAAQMQNPPVRKSETHREEKQPSFDETLKPEPQDPLAGLFKDKEKLLILLLIMVLSEESTNLELVLALLYIII
ncbi:MAG: hypothetical protein IJZ54_02805 [Clostridia bacterium]|nr:hypothetical protein [Clostridia bacterium]